MSDQRQGDLTPPLGFPGGPCHVIRRIRDEVRNPKIQQELVEDIEMGMKLDNQQASKVYDLEAEKGAGSLSRVLLTSHAQYRMDQRGVTLSEVRLALAGWSKTWSKAKGLLKQDVRKRKLVELQSKGRVWEKAIARREPLNWTDPRFGLTIVFLTDGKVARVVTTYWRGQSDPKAQDENTCRLAKYKMPAEPSVQLEVSPKSKKNLPTDIDREKEQVLPPGAATPGGVSDDSTKRDDKRDVPKYELNRPDNDLPDRPRTLPTPGEDYGHPTKFDYNMPTRRHEVAASSEAVGRIVEAYKRRWKPGQRQRKQRGQSKVERQRYYRANKSRIKTRTKQRYRKTKHNPQFKRVRKHRQKYPGQHKRRMASPEAVTELYMRLMPEVLSPVIVAALYLEGFEPPAAIFPKKRQHVQRGVDRTRSKKDYRQYPPARKKIEQRIRYRKCIRNPKCKKQREIRPEKPNRFERRKSPKPPETTEQRQRREQNQKKGYVLTSPQISFIIGKEMVPGTVHNVSPMTGMVTFVIGAKDWEHLHSLPVMAFFESVVFLSDDDIDAFFDLVDVELGSDAYQEIDLKTVRECARIYNVNPDDQQFADQCKALVGQSDFGNMTTEQLGIVNDVLVTGLLEGGDHRKTRDDFSDEKEDYEGEGDIYDWHLIYGIVPDPEEVVARVAARFLDAGTIFQYDQEGTKQEIDHPAPNSGYGPTSPSHWRGRPDPKDGLPKGQNSVNKHLDNAPPASSRVTPPGDGTFWSGDETYVKAAATMDDISRRTSPEVHARAMQVSIKNKRNDPKRGIWTFVARGSQGRTYTVRLKGLRKGNTLDVRKLQVQVSCSCNFFRWQGPEHWAQANKYLYGRPRGTASSPDIKDPGGNHWACKHIVAVFQRGGYYRVAHQGCLRWSSGVEVVPDWDWAEQWGESVGSVADRFLCG